MIILPDQLLKLRQITKKGHSSTSIHEGRLEYPEVAVSFAEKGFGTSRFTIKITLTFFPKLLC